jgi:pyridoxine 5-phosphate synthase
VLKAALAIERFGASGITVHPRPDGRHIRTQDVYDIAQNISVEFNIEGYPSADYIALVNDVKPAQATLVPDPPDVITSNAGWRVVENMQLLRRAIDQLKPSGARVSIFIDPVDYLDSNCQEIKDTGADRIELYTEAYAKAFGTPSQKSVLESYRVVGERVHRLGLGVNAGHDLNLDNLRTFIRELGCIAEVSIGQALISDALYFGLEETVKRYTEALV